MRLIKSSVVLILILLSFQASLFSKGIEIYGTLSDDASTPLPYVSVMIKDDATQVLRGTISDLNGNFKIFLDDEFKNDTLRFSCVGFETRSIPVPRLRIGAHQVVRLNASTTMLETMIFEDLKPSELLRKCIEEIGANYRNVSFVNEAFYWKAVKQDSVYKSLEEAHMRIREDHSAKHSRRFFTYDSVLLTGESATNFIILDSIENLFFFDFIRAGSGITNPDNLEEWKCEYLNVDSKEFMNSTVIQATRRDNLGQFRIYINGHDYSFARIEFSYRWPDQKHALNDSLVYKLSHVEGIVQYQKTDQKYSIKYLYVNTHYTAYKPYTSDKIFSRSTDFEFTLLSSLEMAYKAPGRAATRRPVGRPVIVNTIAYCKARRALGLRSAFCE